MILKSFAKINCHLGILGKFKKFHKIETLVIFLNLFDEITIKKSLKKNHQIKFVGFFSKGIQKNNTVKKLLNLLDEKKLLKNKKYFIKIKKNIPLKSGMGGGSMNAASLLKFFVKSKSIAASRKDIYSICNKIGSDVILGLSNRPAILKKNGKIIRISKKVDLPVILIKPNFGCSSKLIYKKVKYFRRPILRYKKEKYLNIENIKKFRNDLENIVISKYPQLKY